MLDLVFAPVAEVSQLLHQLVEVHLGPAHDLQRLGVLDVWPQTLKERPDWRDDHGGNGRTIGSVTQPPQTPHELQPSAHRLDPGADALERQRLPSGEHGHLSGT